MESCEMKTLIAPAEETCGRTRKGDGMKPHSEKQIIKRK